MKKLLIFACVALGLLACGEKNTPDDGKDNGGTNLNEITCDPSVVEFDIAENVNQTLKLTAIGSWNATTNVDWIQVEPVNGIGNAYVKLTAKGGKVAEGFVIFSTENASTEVVVRCINKYQGSFSVSATQKVYFSKGNLQYQANTNTWRFAEHQYDIIGAANSNISSAYNGWIDLFGWGTSGYSQNPYMSSLYSSSYNNNKKDIAGTNYDWGVYNKISNGGNQAGLWRTLTKDEWKYVFFQRKNASSLYGLATINGTRGYIILPDAWETPSGVIWNGGWSYNYSDNQYSVSQWSIMENAGAIFLPLAGLRKGTEVSDDSSFYWSSSFEYERPDDSSSAIESTTYAAWCVYVQNLSKSFIVNATNCCNGCAVRLVKDVK